MNSPYPADTAPVTDGAQAHDDLDLLAGLLFAPARVEVLRPGRRPAPGTRARLTSAVLPLRRTRVLVPADAPAAAARALHRSSAHTTPAGAALRWGVAGLVRLGAGRLAAPLGIAAADPARSAFATLARAVLGHDDLVFAAGLGVARPNRKPVVQVLRRNGTLLAFAKVGVSPLTDALVRHEAEVLERLAGRHLGIEVPRLLGAGEVGRHPVVFQSPVAAGAVSGAGAPRPPFTAAAAIAASAGGLRHRMVLDTEWWDQTAGRLDPATADTLARSLRGRHLAFGAAHGDFTPWNLSAGHGRIAVWDWERYRPGVPVGFDVAHFAFWATRGRRGDQRALQAARDALGGCGMLDAPDATDLVLRCYLADLVARFADPRLAGDAGSGHLRDALTAALRSTLDPASG